MMPGDRISRIHGPLVTDDEVERVVRHLQAQGEPDYRRFGHRRERARRPSGGALGLPLGEAGNGEDAQYAQAVQIVARDGKASTSYLQRKLRDRLQQRRQPDRAHGGRRA